MKNYSKSVACNCAVIPLHVFDREAFLLPVRTLQDITSCFEPPELYNRSEEAIKFAEGAFLENYYLTKL